MSAAERKRGDVENFSDRVRAQGFNNCSRRFNSQSQCDYINAGFQVLDRNSWISFKRLK